MQGTRETGCGHAVKALHALTWQRILVRLQHRAIRHEWDLPVVREQGNNRTLLQAPMDTGDQVGCDLKAGTAGQTSDAKE